jgi:hypothetical protein
MVNRSDDDRADGDAERARRVLRGTGGGRELDHAAREPARATPPEPAHRQ